MTNSNDKIDPQTSIGSDPPERGNTLLSWVLVILGFGAIALAAKFIPAML